MDVAWDEYDEDGNNLVTLLPALSLEDSDESEDEIAEAESRDAIFRVVKKYESAPVTGEPGEGDVDPSPVLQQIADLVDVECNFLRSHRRTHLSRVV